MRCSTHMYMCTQTYAHVVVSWEAGMHLFTFVRCLEEGWRDRSPLRLDNYLEIFIRGALLPEARKEPLPAYLCTVLSPAIPRLHP